MDENKYTRDEEESIELRDLWFIFRQHFVGIILAAVLVAAGVAAFCRFVVTPTYSATSKLYIVSASSDSVVNLTDLQIGTNLTSDYQDLLLSRPMMESTIQALDLDISVNTLRDMLSITNPKGTRILNITATTESASLSADMANTVAKLGVTWLPEVMECNAPNIAEEAVVNHQKAAPHTLRNTILGAFISGVIAYLIYLIAFLMDDSILSAEDMERYFGLTPLASIPFAPEISHRKGDSSKRNRGRFKTKSGRRSKGGEAA